MSRKNVLTLAVLLGAVTTFLIYLFLTRQGAHPVAGEEDGVASAPTYVVVPREAIRPMQLLRADMFRMKKVSRREAPREAVANPADLADKVAIQTLPAGEPVDRHMVSARTPDLGLPYAVRPPRRAVTIALDQVIGVAGFAKPGNRVDVLGTFDTQRGVGMVTRTVLQDIEVLAVGSDVREKPRDSVSGKEGEAKVQPTATLAVLPSEAEKLFLAEARGKLRLALRPVEDDTYRSRTGVTEIQVTGVAPEGPAKSTPSLSPATIAAPSSRPSPSPAPIAAPSFSTAPTYAMAPRAITPDIPAPTNHEREIEVIRGTEKQIVKVKDGGK